MALTRKWLAAMGIESDKIDEIVAANAESLEGIKSDRDKYKAEADKFKADAAKLADVQKELDDLKAAKGADDSFKEKYEKEHADFEAYKNDQTAKETKAKKTEAYRKLLKEAGISEKHLETVLKASDIDSIEFDEKGNVKGSKDKLKAIKDDWSDLITVTSQQGVNTANPPANNGDRTLHGTGHARAAQQKYYEMHYGVSGNNNQTTNGGNE